MLHFGDITKISGFDAPTVDVIVGGSPCQDLSIAGKRAGLDGERSGLFMEQIRIIKEMRENDRRNGRAAHDVRPRYMVWENVPGAFSSNKGEDFRIVLEETAKVADKDASVPMPDKGKWSNAGCIMGDGWSIAWRILDAQFWGVPQRRRRIALVADFGGQSASEILFVRKSVSGHFEPSEPQREKATSNASGSSGADDREGDVPYTLKIRSGVAVDSYGKAAGKGALIQKDLSATLSVTQDQTLFQPVYSIENHPADSRVDIDESGKVQTLTGRMGTGGGNVPMVMECFSKSKRAQTATDFETWKESDKANTLNAFDVGEVRATELVVCVDQGGGKSQCNVTEGKTPTLTCTHGGEPAVCYCIGNGQVNDAVQMEKELCKTLNCMCDPMKVCVAVDARNGTESETNGALQSNSAHSLNGNNVIRVRYIVRRLTPTECERLQGFPDGWTDIGDYTDTNGKNKKASDSARYKALGNSIAIPPWKWVMKRISACYERDATLASLFDGIGGFPYIWEQINGKGSCLWASEIEEFCIAVTKQRI